MGILSNALTNVVLPSPSGCRPGGPATVGFSADHATGTGLEGGFEPRSGLAAMPYVERHQSPTVTVAPLERTGMTIALHHVLVSIPPGGEEAVLGFYGDLLGLKQIPKPTNLAKRGGVWFTTDTLQLHLGIDDSFVASTKAHVAFLVPDLALLRSRLQAAGVVIVEDEPLEGFARFYVSDPFGNRVECLQRLPRDGRETD